VPLSGTNARSVERAQGPWRVSTAGVAVTRRPSACRHSD
jgi:hypothetical protein